MKHRQNKKNLVHQNEHFIIKSVRNWCSDDHIALRPPNDNTRLNKTKLQLSMPNLVIAQWILIISIHRKKS